MRGHDPVARGRWDDLISNTGRTDYLLKKLRACISVITYLNRDASPPANRRLANIINNIGTQLQHAQEEWNQGLPAGQQIRLVEFWREWSHDFFDEFLPNHTRDFCLELIAAMRDEWQNHSGQRARQVLDTLRTFEQTLQHPDFMVSTDRFDDGSDDDDSGDDSDSVNDSDDENVDSGEDSD